MLVNGDSAAGQRVRVLGAHSVGKQGYPCVAALWHCLKGRMLLRVLVLELALLDGNETACRAETGDEGGAAGIPR
jgi:hypothetical protein